MIGLALFLTFIVVPLVELIIIFKTADAFGWLETIVVLVVISFVGASLVRRAGLRALIRSQSELAQGRMPTNAVVDGLIVLVAGLLMLTPGFLTDAVGLLLLFPPVRVLVRRVLIRRYRDRLRVGSVGGGRAGRFWSYTTFGDEVIDAESFEVNDRELDQ